MGSFKIWIAGASLVLMGACQQMGDTETAMPRPASVQKSVETTAVVQLVDMESRQVLLEEENGRLLTIVAGPEVRNLAQVEPGDIVMAVHEQSVAVQMAPRSQASSGTQTVVAAARAPEGDRPAAMVGDAVRMVVRIVSFDPQSNLVVFAEPDGFVHSVIVQEPQMQEFARGLNPGDEVEVTFTEAIAVAVVEPAQ